MRACPFDTGEACHTGTAPGAGAVSSAVREARGDAECVSARLDSRSVRELRVARRHFRDSTVRKQAGPWLILRRRPLRSHPFLIRTPSRVPRASRASVSCTRARTSRTRSPLARVADWRWTPRWPRSTPAPTVPSTHWRRRYSLMLGLERVLSDDEPRLADGTTLNPHQVDALSGTLTALLAEAQRNGATPRPVAAPVLAVDEEPEDEPSDDGEDLDVDGEIDFDEDEDESEDGEPEAEADAYDEDETPDDVDEDVAEALDDPNAHKRFWFEHATGAGKTVAAMGFVEASRTGGILILTHRRNLVDQFNGELRDRGYADRVTPPLLTDNGGADATKHIGPVTVETYQWFVRNAGRISDAYTIVICDEAHTALGEKTSAAIRAWTGPIFIGMTATGALIARHVTDLFPTQTSRFDLAQAARRGVIAPLRDIRIPPGPGVRTIAKVPLRRGDVDVEFDQEMLAELLDQLPFNLAIADLYKTRFNGVPGVIYAAGVRHAYNVAEAFRDLGIKAEAVSGETPKRELAEILAKYEHGDIDVLVNAQLLAEGWNSPARDGVHAPRADGLQAHLPAARRPRHAPPSGQGGGRGRRLRPPRDEARRPRRHAALAARPRRLPRRRDRRRAGAPRPRPAGARRAPRHPGHGRRGSPARGLRARALADRRRVPRLRRAAHVGGARGRAGRAERLAPRAGDAPLRPQRRAQAPLPAHRGRAQPQLAAAPARAAGDRGREGRRGLRSVDRRDRDLAARRAPRGHEDHAPGAGREAHRPPRPGQRLDLAPGRVHARGARGVRRAALAGDEAPARPARELERRRARAQRAPARPRGAQARPPAVGRAARRRGRAHAGGRGGAPRGADADGPQAERALARAAAQLPQGQGSPVAPAAQEGRRRRGRRWAWRRRPRPRPRRRRTATSSRSGARRRRGRRRGGRR